MNPKMVFDRLVIPVIIASTVLLFLNPFKFYIFGQDSITFIGLFSFNQNPLFTFNDGIEMTYFSIVVRFFTDVFRSTIIAEDVIIFLGAVLAIIGIFDLIDVLNFKFSRKVSLSGKILASSFFLYNPFTLSVTWAHISEWSFLMVLVPFVISFLTDTLYNGGNLKRFLVTTLLLFILAPGAAGPLLPFVLIVICVFLVFWFYSFIRTWCSHESRGAYLKKLGYFILFPLVAFVWDFVPMFEMGASFAIPPAGAMSLFPLFYSESKTTSLFHVLSLFGYSWIYVVQNAYPWIGLLQVIELAGYSLLFLIPFAVKMVEKSEKVRPLAVIAILAVTFSVGSNPPFGIINYQLLRIRGPFMILVNAYYFVGQFYVLFLSVLIYFVLSLSLSSLPRINFRKDSKSRLSRYEHYMISNYKALITIAVIIAILGVSTYPFFSEQVGIRRE